MCFARHKKIQRYSFLRHSNHLFSLEHLICSICTSLFWLSSLPSTNIPLTYYLSKSKRGACFSPTYTRSTPGLTHSLSVVHMPHPDLHPNDADCTIPTHLSVQTRQNITQRPISLLIAQTMRMSLFNFIFPVCSSQRILSQGCVITAWSQQWKISQISYYFCWWFWAAAEARHLRHTVCTGGNESRALAALDTLLV